MISTSMDGFTKFLLCSISLISILHISSAAVDTISGNQTIREGDTIVSAAGKFEMGFFSPSSSKNRYLGIWYKNIATGTVVWVANRDIPLNNTSGVLKINGQGFLVLVNVNNTIIWSSNSSRYIKNPIVQLLDTGNLVMRDGSEPENLNLVWQSFDYPGDTLLPGMKIGKDLVTGLDKYLSSWKSSDDPSHGDYTNYLDPNGYPQIFVRKGKGVVFRSGPWNGLSFSGLPNLKANQIYAYEFVFNQEEIYYKYELINSSVVTRMVLNPSGILQRLTWIDRIQDWSLYLAVEEDTCDRFAICGAYGSCDINNSPACGCLDRFKPKSPEEWVVADWSNGCVRRTQLDCEKGDDGFLRYSGVKLPDTKHSWFNQSINLEQCQKLCLSNCSCTAYANMDIRRGGSGCFLWFGELIDIRHYNENGQDLYLRMAASELEIGSSPHPKGRLKIIVIPILLTAVVLVGLLLLLRFSRRMKLKREGLVRLNQDLELPFFDFETIDNATNNFSIDNKLGEGGFGPVYKGVLDEGQEIAVKRLSKSSRQGLDEFKNEVLCISKLQHRNLVKFLGYCIQDDERMLIYEYLPNKSMDFFIFDKKQSMLLDWPKRYNIIKGIARGLLYLHQDSRLRIIHRDLKAANILLDNNMNPKISDFGMARIFGGDETEANTTRVVGTYGYMSPEYASDGFFSVKSDVYSFGVLVLEIVSGSKNRGFSHPDHSLNLLGHAWTFYKEGKPLELIDASIVESCNLSEALRSIHIGLLCVQQSPEDRPSMPSVVQMLGSETALPQPKEPGFYTGRKFSDVDLSSSKPESCSANQLTVTMLAPR